MIPSLLLRPTTRVVVAVLLCAAAASCEDTTGSIPSEAVGTYTLVQVNGMALPARVTDTPEQQVDIVSGAMTVRADGSYRETRTNRVTDASGTRTGSSFTEGTLHVTGSSLEVRERLGGTYSGSYAGETLSYTVSTGASSVSFTYDRD